MSMQCGFNKEQEETILKILDDLKIDYKDNEVTINISSYEEPLDGREGDWDCKVNPYIQVE